MNYKYQEKLSVLQIESLKHIEFSFLNNKNPICAIGPGSGKTWVGCEVIHNVIKDHEDDYRILIVHKAINYIDPWLNDLKLYQFISEPEGNKKNIINKTGYIYIHGKGRERNIQNGYYYFPRKNIILTSYDTLRLDIELNRYNLKELFDLIIFDELHTIINRARLTKKSKWIYQIPARRKLTLTASPIQNDTGELGLIYAFLNDSPGFQELMNLYTSVNIINANESEKENIKIKKEIISAKLNKYCDLCEKENIVFYFAEEKRGFTKKVITLSVPINEIMHLEVDSMSKKLTPNQIMYLSHPAAVDKEADKSTSPHCTKEDAVRIILRSMGRYEKMVIFSLYIDVLLAYAEVCRNLGYPAMLIIGDDKSNKLKGKLLAFENSTQIRVLLTTLPKSAEGFNFHYATHVIILEFWWNPQKIMQAMCRIDRKTQKYNIFIYLLCYNSNGILIKQEKWFYDKMVKKLEDSNNIYQRIEINHPKHDTSLVPVYKDIPEIRYFTEIDSFEYELESFISQFEHSPIYDEINYDEQGFPLINVRNGMLKETNQYLYYCSILNYRPWRIEWKEVKRYLDRYYKYRLFGEHGHALRESINSALYETDFNSKLDASNTAIFIDRHYFIVHLVNNRIEKLNMICAIGKKKTGKNYLIGVYYDEENSFTYTINKLKERGIRYINVIISKVHNQIDINKEVESKYPNTNCQFCLADFYKRITFGVSKYQNDIDLIEQVFLAKTEHAALKLCETADSKNIINKFLFKKINRSFPAIKGLYAYKAQARMTLCTINIVTYLTKICEILLQERVFNNTKEAIRYINIVFEKVLENGENFIPNWENLSKPVDEL